MSIKPIIRLENNNRVSFSLSLYLFYRNLEKNFISLQSKYNQFKLKIGLQKEIGDDIIFEDENDQWAYERCLRQMRAALKDANSKSDLMWSFLALIDSNLHENVDFFLIPFIKLYGDDPVYKEIKDPILHNLLNVDIDIDHVAEMLNNKITEIRRVDLSKETSKEAKIDKCKNEIERNLRNARTDVSFMIKFIDLLKRQKEDEVDYFLMAFKELHGFYADYPSTKAMILRQMQIFSMDYENDEKIL